jgi:ABC-type branched-subunit amino acid transport system ATPase component
VFDGFDLDVAPGEIVALLGPSGSGKTTLLNLLLGLAPLSGGEVLIGDQRLSHLGSIAASVAWAGQSPVVLPGTLADNLALAIRRDREEIEAAAARSAWTPCSTAAAGWTRCSTSAARAVGRRAAAAGPGPRLAQARPDPAAGRADRRSRRGVGGKPAADPAPAARAAPP